MPHRLAAYPAAHRERIIALVRAGRSPKELAKELEPSGHTIRNWGFWDGADPGERLDALTIEERTELQRLPRENRQLKVERDILGRAEAGSRGSPGRSHPSLRFRERESGPRTGGDDV